jgi:ATP-binding cassette subfamily B protein
VKYPFLAPEVIQISTMDCGIAAIKCMLSAFDVPVSYEWLREACQTSVDGTSIDALEDIANDLGVPVAQQLVPLDLLTEGTDGHLPAIILEQLEGGRLHYVVLWRRLGRMLQIMDPRGGRRWVAADDFMKEVFVHMHPMPAPYFFEWFTTTPFRTALEQRARRLLPRTLADQYMNDALESGVDGIAAFDAALRLVDRVDASSNLSSNERRTLFERTYQEAKAAPPGSSSVPEAFWSIQRRGDTVLTRAAVYLSVPPDQRKTLERGAVTHAETRARHQSTDRPSLVRDLWALLGTEARFLACALVIASATTAAVSVFQILLFRAAVDAPHVFTTFSTRVESAVAFGLMLLVMVALEVGLSWGFVRLGRAVELRLRVQTFELLPRVDETFVSSRPTSDLAERAHNLVSGQQLPSSILSITRVFTELILTFIAIAWLDVHYVPVVLGGATAVVLVAVLSRSKLREVETRFHVHASRLITIFLDTLRGVRPVRLHGYQSALRREQRDELKLWRRTGLANIGISSLIAALDEGAGITMLALLFITFAVRGGDPRAFVVLAFWAFRLPGSLRGFVALLRAYPGQRTAVTRLLEITRYAPAVPADVTHISSAAQGVAIRFEDVSVVATGRHLLSNVNLDIPAGQHVAIVGASGSGKSSLVGVLLGIHRVHEGRVTVDRHELDAATLRDLRRTTSWIDPGIHLWNDTLLANVEYAARGFARRPLVEVLEASLLLGVLDGLQSGFETDVGAEGTLLSGGEGQRLRIARAMLRAPARLAILDEPFRGLDRDARKRLTLNARLRWRSATMFFVTHDISHVLDFDRVLVVDNGRLVEDGHPLELAANADSYFKTLLDAERSLHDEIWEHGNWRRVRVQGGILRERGNGGRA